ISCQLGSINGEDKHVLHAARGLGRTAGQLRLRGRPPDGTGPGRADDRAGSRFWRVRPGPGVGVAGTMERAPALVVCAGAGVTAARPAPATDVQLQMVHLQRYTA